MTRLIIIACAFFTSASTANAGCATYGDGGLSSPPPEVVICFKGKCEETTQEYSCGNVFGAQWGYANGWKMAVAMEGDKQTEWVQTPNGMELNTFKDISCYTNFTDTPDACPQTRH